MWYKQVCGYYGHPMANKNGVILKHRLVMSESIGRILDNNDIVHHIDGDKHNNIISNLELTTRSSHASIHGKENESVMSETCSFCGEMFTRKTRNIKYKKQQGQKDFYCSRTCMGSHFGHGRTKKPDLHSGNAAAL